MKVGEQRHGESEMLPEGPVTVDGVDAHSDQGGVLGLDVAQDLLVDAELVGARGAEVRRIEREHEPAAREVREADAVAVLVAKREVGRGRTRLDHRGAELATQAELADQGPVALDVVALEVTEQAAALADEHQEPAARVVVLAMLAEMLRELVDPLGEQRDLNGG